MNPTHLTTCPRPLPHHTERAKRLCARLNAVFVPRNANVARLMRDLDISSIYVVGRHRDEVRTLSSPSPLYIEPGLFHYKRRDSTTHPLLRAVSPPSLAPPAHLLDATLGLAHDALHIAAVLPHLTISGCEVNPALFSLLEEGLPRLSNDSAPWSNAASRITPHHTHALHHLSSLPTDSIPVVYLDPMFSTPAQNAPSFDTLRTLACNEPLSQDLLNHACRVASRRVVVKIPAASPNPPALPPHIGWNRRVRSQAVDYVIAEYEHPNPTYEAPNTRRRGQNPSTI